MFEWTAENVRLYGTSLSFAIFLFFVLFYFFKHRLEMKVALWTKSSQKYFFVLLFLASFAFAIRLPFIWFNAPSDDEPYYISASLLYMEGFSEGLGSDKFIANFEHPPIAKYALGLYLKLLFPGAHLEYGSLPNEDLLFCSRLFNIFIGSVSVVPLFLLAEKIKRNLGILASVFFAINPSHARISGLAYLDAPMIFLGICSMLFTLRFLDKPNWKNMFISGFFIGLLLGTKWVQPILYIIPMVLLILLHYREKILLYVTTLVVGFCVLIASWWPLIWRFGLNGIIDFFSWVNSHWVSQFSMSRENTLLDVALWNMSVPELTLFGFCFVILFVCLTIDIKDKRVSYLHLLPIIAAAVFLIALQLEKRGAVYYWTMITPIASIILAEGLSLLKDHIVVSYKPCMHAK